ncbi:hypothetical protein Bbelb_262680 [Branchiostoma belcheri]|nr:hypothetical protein Bbelb_262680 [Branchiostoma belcheri]
MLIMSLVTKPIIGSRGPTATTPQICGEDVAGLGSYRCAFQLKKTQGRSVFVERFILIPVDFRSQWDQIQQGLIVFLENPTLESKLAVRAAKALRPLALQLPSGSTPP